MLIEKIKKDLIESLKSGKKAQVSLIRLLLAAIKDKEIALKKNLDSENAISDEEILEIINKMIKQRKFSAQTYIEANRKDYAEKENIEADMLKIYLPEQISDKNLNHVISELILQSEAKSLRDMGKVMKLLKENYSGRCDLQKASSIIKEKLSDLNK